MTIRRSVLLTGFIALAAGSAHALDIDNFSVGTLVQVAPIVNQNPGPSSGGFGRMVNATGSAPNLTVELNGGGSLGGYGHSQDAGVTGTSSITYAMGGVNLSNNANAFRLELSNVDLNGLLRITVDGVAFPLPTTTILVDNGAAIPSFADFLFSDFPGADFGNVNEIVLEIDGTAQPALDVTTDSFSTVCSSLTGSGGSGTDPNGNIDPAACQLGAGGMQPGSAVLYPLFQLESEGYRTVIRLTNNHPTDDVTVHLVYVCGGEKDPDAARRCDAGNREVTLTHNQTKNWNVENFFTIGSACITRSGFVLAYAVDPTLASVPIEWNWLSGSTYQRRLPSAFKPNSTAGSQALVFEGDPGKVVAQGAALPGAVGGAFPLLPFDGIAYQQLATVLRSDFIATTDAVNPANGRRSAIALLTLDIQAGFQNPETVVALDWWNQAENIFSTSHEYICHTYKELQDISGSFELGNLGSFYGNLLITPFGADAIQGQIKELEPNRETLRKFFHDAVLRSTVFQSR